MKNKQLCKTNSFPEMRNKDGGDQELKFDMTLIILTFNSGAVFLNTEC